MVYTETVQGVTVYSNVPFDFDATGGTLVEIDMHWVLPIADIVALGYDIDSLLGWPNFVAQLALQGIPESEVGSYNVYAADASTTRVAFIAKGIGVLVVLAIIVALVVVGIGLIDLLAYIYYLWSQTPAGSAINYGLAAIGIGVGIALITGVGIFGYSFYKSKEFRQETVKSATAGLRYARETVAPAVTRSASQAASYASRGVQLLRSSRSPESEEP